MGWSLCRANWQIILYIESTSVRARIANSPGTSKPRSPTLSSSRTVDRPRNHEEHLRPRARTHSAFLGAKKIIARLNVYFLLIYAGNGIAPRIFFYRAIMCELPLLVMNLKVFSETVDWFRQMQFFFISDDDKDTPILQTECKRFLLSYV